MKSNNIIESFCIQDYTDSNNGPIIFESGKYYLFSYTREYDDSYDFIGYDVYYCKDLDYSISKLLFFDFFTNKKNEERDFKLNKILNDDYASDSKFQPINSVENVQKS